MPSIFMQLDLRVKNPKVVNGKKKLVTTVKTRVSGSVQETTLRRTIDGKRADLQLKFINHPNGEVEYLHIHCLTDKESSSWGKSSGQPIEKFYELSQEKGSQIVRCKICKQAWPIKGWTPD
jgi:hypothetical protein